MAKKYSGSERRQFLRISHSVPLAYKVCKRKTVWQLLQGYTSNISQSGLLCKIREKVKKGDLLWLAFDHATLTICHNLEDRALIYQNGIIGKVVRVTHKNNASFDVGVQFVTREEKDLAHMYPKMHLSEKNRKA